MSSVVSRQHISEYEPLVFSPETVAGRRWKPPDSDRKEVGELGRDPPKPLLKLPAMELAGEEAERLENLSRLPVLQDVVKCFGFRVTRGSGVAAIP
mmetsp:Transcript_146866/g.208184  ORF Transcript_146866/g.208184 Transcript_146866/m.208184 type:complete len:96 (-) Transcript_146866:93-380(-)